MPDFTDTYFKRFLSYDEIIGTDPEDDLFLSVVIPAFNEPDLCSSLQSLTECTETKYSVEVLVVINSPENCNVDILKTNARSYEEATGFAKLNSSKKLKFRIMQFKDLPEKFAGVGLARKIGMDEALRRFGKLNRPNGLIAGFDADARVEKNYLSEIEKHYIEHPQINAYSIHFEHPIAGDDFDEETYLRIINYELHLRYLNESLRYAKFPYAYHTIGSSFAVRADVYAKQGGMNRKKAGEDFYFLQKIIPLGNFGEINSTAVIPSPRLSDRVPFGTGAALKKMTENSSYDFLTYDFEVFKIIKQIFDNIDVFFTEDDLTGYHESLTRFLIENNFSEGLKDIRRNSPDLKIFRKRFFDWFNAFRLIKFLNYAHNEYFTKQPVKSQAEKLADQYYSAIFKAYSEKELLLFFREKQKISDY